jgi:polar amino acid transport system substrate-binding protein
MCVDSDPPPPGSLKLDSNGKKIIPVEGATIDIVRAAFARLGIPIEFDADMPWKRCLLEVEEGIVDFALGAYFNDERAKVYDYSIHYNTLTPQLFYLASNPVHITQPSDLKKYRGCGIYGSSYVHYQINSEDLVMGSDYDSLYRKLLAGRCDYFAEELESVYESHSGKTFLANPLIRHIPAEWAQRPARHLITAKNGPNASPLLQINTALEAVIKSGQAEQLWKKTMGDLPYSP